MEVAIVLHETIHGLHRRKLKGVIFKVDFEKANDKVKWTPYNRLFISKGSHKCGMIGFKLFVQGGNVGIKINVHLGALLTEKKS